MSSTRTRGTFSSQTESNERWTYRFYREGGAGEKHFDTEELALNEAINDIELYRADPVHIRIGRRIAQDRDDIYDAWSEKFLR